MAFLVGNNSQPSCYVEIPFAACVFSKHSMKNCRSHTAFETKGTDLTKPRKCHHLFYASLGAVLETVDVE